MFPLQNEKLVRVEDHGFLVEPAYFNVGLSGDRVAVVRETIITKLKEAREVLPSGYNFKVWDGYRKTIVQRRLYDGLYKKLAQLNTDWNEERLHAGVLEFVAAPTTDPEEAAPHNTGGTVDLTIVDENGVELDMGTGFDHFHISAHTFHFAAAEEGTPELRSHQNRMILYEALTSVGFFNYPAEWWHFSYGDLKWAKHYKKEPLYASAEFPVSA